MAVNIRVTVDDADLRRVIRRFRDFENAVALEVFLTMRRLLPSLQRRLPVESGELRRSVTVARDGATVRISINAPYAVFLVYRRPRFRARTVRQTLARWRRTPAFRRELREAVARAVRRTLALPGP